MTKPAPLPSKDRQFKTLRSILALVLREMSARHGRTTGGYFWAILEPIAGIALMSVAFSLALRTPPIGVNFQIYFATGFMAFIFFREIESKISAAIRFSRSLLQYPGVSFIDSIFARLILTSITQLLIMYIVFGGILMVWETRSLLQPYYILSSLGTALILGVGIGTLNCYLTGVLPVWQTVWSILNRPLILMSGVIFLHDSVPEPWKTYLEWNPLVHVVGQMRRGFYANYPGEYVDMVYPCGVGLTCLVIGLILLNRYNRAILNQL